MDKEKIAKCLPMEMTARLRRLAERLWQDNNPAAVHLSAVLDEFEDEIGALDNVLKEYQDDYRSRLSFMEKEYAEKVRLLEDEVQDFRDRLAGFEKLRDEKSRRLGEAENELRAARAEISSLKASVAEQEAELNARFAEKTHELYEKLARKEAEMLSRWESKNAEAEERLLRAETEMRERSSGLAQREKALEDDFAARKAELLRTLDKVRNGLEARERALAEREARSARGGEGA